MVARIPGKLAAGLHQLNTSRQNRDAVITSLTSPYCAVARLLKRGSGEGGIGALDLLKTNHVGFRLSQPCQQVGEPLLDPVDVESGDLHEVRSRGSARRLFPLREKRQRWKLERPSETTMRLASALPIILASSLSLATAAHAERHYDCSKPGNATKAACKTAVPAAATTQTSTTVPAVKAGPHYDCTKPGNAKKAACKAAPVATTAAMSVAPGAPPTTTATKTERHYDCTKAGNATKAACKSVPAAPTPVAVAKAAPPVVKPSPAPVQARPVPVPIAAPAAAAQQAGGTPRIVAWTEKNGKTVHYDCSKRGNLNKHACKQ